MPFQDSSTMRPLMDQVDGGPPAAWKCLLPEKGRLSTRPLMACGKITSTLAGMLSHQKQVHGFEPQLVIEHGNK